MAKFLLVLHLNKVDQIKFFFFFFFIDLGPVSERRLSESSEYVNTEMRGTLGFPLLNGRFVKPGKAG